MFNKLYSSTASWSTYTLFTVEADNGTYEVYPSGYSSAMLFYSNAADLYNATGIVASGKDGSAEITRLAGGNWEESYLFTNE
jgi:hypothetical protein